jgi:hypothetical protein
VAGPGAERSNAAGCIRPVSQSSCRWHGHVSTGAGSVAVAPRACHEGVTSEWKLDRKLAKTSADHGDFHGRYPAGGRGIQHAQEGLRTNTDSQKLSESTSQAEYAGSIPVIGSTKHQLSGIVSNLRHPPRAILDRRLTVGRRHTCPKGVCWLVRPRWDNWAQSNREVKQVAKYLAWIGATVIALAGIVIGVLPIDTGPRWVWLTIGIAFGLLAAFTFLTVWRSNDQAGAPSTNKKVEQKPTMIAGERSTQIVNEGGGTFNIGREKES